MNPADIAKLYLEGRRMRAQAKQLSQTMLAKKFDRSANIVNKIANGIPVNVPQDEQDLIRACIAERDRLKSRAAELTMPRLCERYRVAHQTIESQLILMGAREVSA